METGKIYHALGLHLHQPPGNMLDMLNFAEQEAIGHTTGSFAMRICIKTLPECT